MESVKQKESWFDKVIKFLQSIPLNTLITTTLILFVIFLLVAILRGADGLGILSISGCIIVLIYFMLSSEDSFQLDDDGYEGGNGDYGKDSKIKKRILKFFKTDLPKTADYLPFLIKVFSIITNSLRNHIQDIDKEGLAQLKENISGLYKSIDQKNDKPLPPRPRSGPGQN